jgi:FtsP/CotA-like multicopper oxidase with cupredoxin domain
VLVDFSNQSLGKEIFLVSNSFSEYNVQERQSFRLMKFNVDRTTSHSFTLPSILSNVTRINSGLAIKTRTITIAQTIGGKGGHGGMGRHAINGKIFEMDRVDETVEKGTTEIWEFDNLDGDEIHPMHIHGVQFQVNAHERNSNI